MRLTRRRLIVAGAGAVAVGAVGAAGARRLLRDETPAELPPKGDFPRPERRVDCRRPGNPVVAENCREGTADWLLTRVEGTIEGFFDASSVARGEEAVLRVRCADPEYRVQVFRSGDYGGAGGRLVADLGPLGSRPQPEPRRDAPTGLSSASNWSVSARLDTSRWPSGVYLAKLTAAGGDQGQAIVVVREDDRRSDLLAFVSDTTYLAYNRWDGYSLYGGEDRPRAVRVSFDRPYGNVQVHQADWYLRVELSLVRWLERQGYDVTYAAASDAGRRALGAHRAWMSASHNEYWSDGMRAAFEDARDAGTGLLFMGANCCYWRVRLEPDPWTGRADRVMACYKSSEVSPTTLGTDRVEDPVSRTSLWRDPKGPNRPENALLGVMYVGQDLLRNYPLVVPAALARGEALWRGTELTELPAGAAAAIGRELVGWEWDAVVDNGLTPPGLRRLAATAVSGDLIGPDGTPGRGDAVAHATAYRAPSGALVFAAGSNLFCWGLDQAGYRLYAGGRPQGEPDPRVQQLVTNVLVETGCRPGSPDVRLTLPA